VPFALCLAAGLLFLVTVEVDHAVARGSVTLPGWISVGGPDDARAILGALLGAVSTVLALIFSVALLVLSIAVSQFGPRMLNRFVRDGITQLTLGLFMATFVYTLLAFVVTRQQGGRQFVPQLTLCSSVALVVLSFVFLVIFSHRVATSIQTQNVVAAIVADLDAAIIEWLADSGTHTEPIGAPAAAAELDALLSRCAAEGAVVRASRTGFIQEIAHLDLVAAAERAEAVVRLLYRPGQFVMGDSVLGYVIPPDRAAALAPLVARHVRIGTNRTLTQDLEFGVAQLVEIALRALSPAINDTFTGLTCIDWLGDELRAFFRGQERSGAWLGSSGTVRLVRPPLRAARLVKTAFDQIRQAASGNPAVSIRLLQTFGRLARQVDNPRVREALAQQAEAVWEAASTDTLVKSDRADVEAAYHATREALTAR
jgi:uncharacterized membrane protein